MYHTTFIFITGWLVLVGTWLVLILSSLCHMSMSKGSFLKGKVSAYFLKHYPRASYHMSYPDLPWWWHGPYWFLVHRKTAADNGHCTDVSCSCSERSEHCCIDSVEKALASLSVTYKIKSATFGRGHTFLRVTLHAGSRTSHISFSQNRNRQDFK